VSVARHTAYNVVGALVPLVVSLITVPLYLKVIGIERYGILSICWLLLGYFGLFELGLGPATAQRIASYPADAANARNELLWNAITLSLGVGALGGCVLFLVGKQLLLLLREVGGLSREIGQSMFWLALCVPATALYGVLNGALQGREQFLTMNVVSSVSNVLLAALPLAAAFYVSPHLPALIAAVFLARLVSTVAVGLACRPRVPIIQPITPSRAILTSLITFGSWVTGAGILTPILTSIEKLVVGFRLGATAVGTYVVPFNLVSRFVLLPQSVASALFPRFASLGTAQIDRMEQDAVRSLASLATPLIVLALAVLPEFLRLWIGPSLAGPTTPIACIVLVGFWFNGFAHISYARLQGTGRPDLVTKISFWQLGPYLVAIYLAVMTAGLVGAAVTWSIRAAVDMLIFFAVTNQPGRLIRIIAAPGAIVLSASVASLFVPLTWVHWGLEGALLLAAVALGYRELASRLAEFFPSILGGWALPPTTADQRRQE